MTAGRSSGGPVMQGGFAGQSGSEPTHDNLPSPLTSFIGREHGVAELAELLEADRLVTLTGAPGVGKTRLALRVADGVRARFEDGVWLVELAGLAEPSLVPSAVARALDLRDVTSRPPIETLTTYLSARQILLILDNCEHLVDACAALVDTVLAACPLLRVLATSRELLGLPGEVAWSVPSLSLPEPAHSGADRPETGERVGERSNPARALFESEAGRLFVERARAVRPGFDVTPRNAAAAVEICRRLDGIPLAIELAAIRLRTLTAGEIAARLDDRFSLLTGGSRTALPRHRTLRAAVDWSYGLLSVDERTLLRRLSVFAGGWTLEAAEAVCAGVGCWVLGVGGTSSPSPTPNTQPPTPDTVLDLLAGLVDKSLVLAEERDSGVRYRMLETIRAYAAEHLPESGEEAPVRQRHQNWFLELAERAGQLVIGPEHAAWGNLIEAELDNIRASLSWVRQAPAAGRRSALERALRLGAALIWFWDVRGHLAEGRAWLAELLDVAAELDKAGAPPVENLARGRGFLVAGYLAFTGGDAPAAEQLLAEALGPARAAGDGFHLAWALCTLGSIALFRGEPDRAAALVHEGQAVARARPEWVNMVGACHYWLGEIEYVRGDRERAVTAWETSLAIVREHSIPWAIPYPLTGLARVAFLEGDYDRAAALHAKALGIRRELDDVRGMAFSLAELAWARAAQGRAEQAALLIGAADAGRERVGVAIVLLRDWHAQRERAVAAAREALGEATFEATYSRGRAMPLEHAVTIALHGEEPGEPPAISVHAPSARAAGGLTRRELAVAALVAHGLTNLQIAEELVLSERTIEWHVTNLLGKLGLSARTQVAVWAVEHGLTAADTV